MFWPQPSRLRFLRIHGFGFIALVVLLQIKEAQLTWVSDFGQQAPLQRVFAISNSAWQSDIIIHETNSSGTAATYDKDVWGVAAGLDGSVYLAGYTKVKKDPYAKAPEGKWDAFVAKFLPSQGENAFGGSGHGEGGELAWAHRHASSGNDDATSVATASDGSVLLAGFTSGSLGGQRNNGQQDAFVSHYSANGTLLWTRLLGTLHREEAKAVCGGKDGTVVVAGVSDGRFGHDALGHRISGGKDAFVAKLSNRGDLLWTQALATTTYDEAKLVAVGDDGSVIVAGYSYGEMNATAGLPTGDVFVARFSPEGRLVWLRQEIIIGAGEADSSLTALACGRNGSIVLAGFTNMKRFKGQINQGGVDAFVVKYSAEGKLMWAKLLGTPFGDRAWSVASTSDDGVLLAGASEGHLGGHKNQGKWDAFVARYSASGKLLWADLLGSEEDDEAKAIVASPSIDELFLVAGYTKGILAGLNGTGAQSVGKQIFGGSGGDMGYASASTSLWRTALALPFLILAARLLLAGQ